MKTSNIKDRILKLSKINPQLTYNHNLAKHLSGLNKGTQELIDIYFNEQSLDYVAELMEYSNLNNNTTKDEKILCFVCCYNETQNIPNLIKNYAKQNSKIDFEVCFIVNFEEDDRTYLNDYENFINTIDLLLLYQKKYSWINIIAKQFKKDYSGLGRARKYGLDYCLFRLSQISNHQIDNSIIISNEGDTLFINENYFQNFYTENINNKFRLIQGYIDYPEFIKENHNIVLDYINIKESIHLGLGVNFDNITAFGGIMPIGRNYSIHPRIAVKIASIDPTCKKGTDDDIKMGLDITNLLGAKFKIYRNIPLVTNPRREVVLIMEYLQGRCENGKKMYEKFHEVKYIYDYSIHDIELMNKYIDNKYDAKSFNAVIQELYIWIFRNVAKTELIDECHIVNTIEKHNRHSISYWEMENELMDFIIIYLRQNPKILLKISEKSNYYFKYFTNISVNKNLASIDNLSCKILQD
jgi:hypothetical protein